MEVDEILRALAECEEQACDLLGHLGVWESGPHAIKSIANLEPLDETSPADIPQNVVWLGERSPDIVGGSKEVHQVASAKVVEGDPDIPLKTYMIPLEEVKVNIEKWRSSIEAEHRSLIVDTRAVEPLSEEAFQTSAKLKWWS